MGRVVGNVGEEKQDKLLSLDTAGAGDSSKTSSEHQKQQQNQQGGVGEGVGSEREDAGSQGAGGKEARMLLWRQLLLVHPQVWRMLSERGWCLGQPGLCDAALSAHTDSVVCRLAVLKWPVERPSHKLCCCTQ